MRFSPRCNDVKDERREQIPLWTKGEEKATKDVHGTMTPLVRPKWLWLAACCVSGGMWLPLSSTHNGNGDDGFVAETRAWMIILILMFAKCKRRKTLMRPQVDVSFHPFCLLTVFGLSPQHETSNDFVEWHKTLFAIHHFMQRQVDAGSSVNVVVGALTKCTGHIAENGPRFSWTIFVVGDFDLFHKITQTKPKQCLRL